MQASDANAEVRAQLTIHRRSYEDNEHKDIRATLQLRDNTSGLVFTEVYLDAQDLADLLSGTDTGTLVDDPTAGHGSRIAGTPAWIIQPERRAMIGLRHYHITERLGATSDIDHERVEQWAEEVRLQTGADSAAVSRRNDNRTYLTLRGYRRTDEQGARWQAVATGVVADNLSLLPRKAGK